MADVSLKEGRYHTVRLRSGELPYWGYDKRPVDNRRMCSMKIKSP